MSRKSSTSRVQQLAELAAVGGRPPVERVAQVRFEHVGDALARVAAGGGDARR